MKKYFFTFIGQYRILILNKQGINHSNITIPVITLFNYQRVSKLEAQTLNLNDKGKVEVTRVKDNSIYYDTIVKGGASKIKFTFPDVKEGSIIEYKYTLSVLGVELTDWLFQSDLPTVRSALSIKIPDFVYYNVRFQGNLPVIIDAPIHYNDRLNDIQGYKGHYAMDNVPAIKIEPFIASKYDHVNKMRFFLVPTHLENGTFIHTLNTSWQPVAKYLSNAGNYFKPLNNVAWGFLAKTLTAGTTDKAEKVRLIYNYVHTAMKWNKLYSCTPSATKLSFAQQGTDTVGNSAEINLILLGMLRTAGIRADPVVISTREHGMVDTTFYNQHQFNSMIVMAELDSTYMLLDAINPFIPWYLLPESDLNVQGLKISSIKSEAGDVIKSEWVNIPVTRGSSTSVTSTIIIDSSGGYSVRSVFLANDYCASQFRDKPDGKTIADWTKSYLKIPDDIDIKDEQAENEADVDKKVKVIFSLEKKNTSPDDSFIYVNPFPLRFYADNPLNQKERLYAFDFGWGLQRNLVCTIPLPKNYKIVESPRPMKIVLDDGSASFTLLVEQNDLTLQISATFKLNRTLYPAEKFNDLKGLYAKMIDACSSIVVLQKM